ncbi:hypothetical protein LTR53_007827 [Teratosphaeriaceae sp. CCFEE 6253]|nr:hypothetical protein LTR53_007827 [Teratosphaeriaceae sp. CCFEE 6253]
MFTIKNALAAVVALTFAGQTIASSLPACWNSCFKTYNVTSEPSLCSPSLGSLVGSCIATSCSAANGTASATQYQSWLCEYCHLDSPSCSTTSSSILATSTSISSVASATTPVTIPVSTTVIPPTTASTSVGPVVPTGSGTPPTYQNATSSSALSYWATSTGSKPSATATPTVMPYTGGAAELAASGGSVVAFVGMIAVALLA